MAKEISRRVNMATRTVVVDVQDAWGNVTHHTLPLVAAVCPMCQGPVPNAHPGVLDINASAAAAVQNVTDIEQSIITKLQAAGISIPTVL